MIRPPSSQCAQCTISSARNLRLCGVQNGGYQSLVALIRCGSRRMGVGTKKGGGFNPFFLVSVEVRGS